MHRRLRSSILGLLLVALAAPAPALAAKRLAVLTPTAPWSPDCQEPSWRKDKDLRERCPVLDALADEARAGALAALRGKGVDVMTRENTAQLLKEMGAGSTCSEGECEVETAKLIGADYVVSGNVLRIEQTWVVTLKLHEVKSARLLDTSERLDGASQMDVVKALRPAAEKLVRSGLESGPPPLTSARHAGAQPLPDTLSPAQINEAVASRIDALRRCVSEQKDRDPRVSGVLKMRWVIGGDGGVRDVRCLTSEYAQGPFAQCVSGVVKTIPFPRSGTSGQEVTFPFSF